MLTRWCSLCRGGRVVVRRPFGAAERAKLGEDERNEETCPRCDGIGVEHDAVPDLCSILGGCA